MNVGEENTKQYTVDVFSVWLAKEGSFLRQRRSGAAREAETFGELGQKSLTLTSSAEGEYRWLISTLWPASAKRANRL